jgi:hypothetical protein
MTLEEYQAMAEEDCKIDKNKIDRKAAEIPVIAAKYLRFLAKEKIKLKALEQQRSMVYRERYAYYGGYADECYQYVLQKSEIKIFLDGDKDLLEIAARVEMQKASTEYLTGVVDILNRMGFSIKNWIDYQKFQSGGY